MEQLRVLHCPTNTAGNAQGLADGERAIGLRSHVVAFHPGPFGMQTDEVLWADDPSLPRRELRRFRLLWRACREFDVIHFAFGLTIMPSWVPRVEYSPASESGALRALWQTYTKLVEQRDLPLLRHLGKTIVVTFQGDDARQGDRLHNFDVSPLATLDEAYYQPEVDAHKRVRIERFARYADQIFALNPDLLHVLPEGASFLPYASVDPQEWKPGPPQRGETVLVHAPSHQGAKGTRFVVEAVDRLRADGIPLQFELVENVDRAEARKTYARATLVVDQLLAGWYGAFAVEAMALGKPAVCFIRRDDLAFVPDEMRRQLPIVNAMPETLYTVLHELLTGPPERLEELGRRGRAYVERWHDPRRIAATARSAYERNRERAA
ncbi:MAG TPA: glycosyltransferase [Gaiellaceae bacterium]|nr:glycosyltransferase [Gaiellaceae bacterium]